MKVRNVNVYDLENSMIASGYPMVTDTGMASDNMMRCITLANSQGGHDQFLSGILVSFDLTCTNKMWVELERYRFITFVSSQSTMHRIAKFDLDKAYNEYVDERIVKIMQELKERYNNEPTKDNHMRLLYSNPAGFELTARLTTNYRCLKNVYHQRRYHRLAEWKDFCKWIETLPFAQEFLVGENDYEK